MNKYVPQSRIIREKAASKDEAANDASENASAGETPRPALAKTPESRAEPDRSVEGEPQSAPASPTQRDKPQEDQPQREKPEPDEAATHQNHPAKAEAQAHLFHRAYWSPRRLSVAGLMGAVLIGLILWLSWRPANEPNVTYDVTKISRGTVTLSVRTTGMLAARDAVAVVPAVGGRVMSVAVQSGDRVTKGQVLARLDSPSLRDEMVRGQTVLTSIQADVTRADADIAAARASAARPRNPAAPSADDAAQARLVRTVADANKLRADLREAELRLAALREKMVGLELRAPAAGIVLRRNVEPGEFVRAAAKQEGLFILADDLSQLDLIAEFPENAIGGLHAGQPAEFTVPAFQGRIFTATLSGLDLQAKRVSKEGQESVTYAGTLAATNHEEVLRPGMSADVAVIAAQAKNVLVVPNVALNFAPAREIESKYPPAPKPSPAAHTGRVWVMNDAKLEPRDITLGLTDGAITQVVAGLRDGEMVVTSAFVKVKGAS